jgi:hypothetical protein
MRGTKERKSLRRARRKGNVIFIAFVSPLNAYKNTMFFSATAEMVIDRHSSLST